jgi:hypothetical protein
VLANSQYGNHVVLTHALHDYLRWRNTHARPPTYSPPNDANAPACAANVTAAGASPHTESRPNDIVVIYEPGEPSWSRH